MLEKINEEIQDWEYHELKELQKEFKNGSQALSKIVSKKIKEYESETGNICPVCNSIINNTKPESFTLIFGPDNLKKKASFCALDCLQYFISRLKEFSKKKVEQ